MALRIRFADRGGIGGRRRRGGVHVAGPCSVSETLLPALRGEGGAKRRMRGSANVWRGRLESFKRCESSVERRENRLAYIVDGAKRIVVPEAQDRIALRQQKRVALLVMRAVRVLA